MKLSPEAVAAGFTLSVHAHVGSTNALALEQAGQSCPDRGWIVATTQSGGRGRHGRRWESPAGNLYATLLLIDPCPVAQSPRLGFVAGIAVADAVRDLVRESDVRLKWPNDLIVAGAKLSGLLLEGRMIGNGCQGVAIGIGVNLASAPEIAGRTVTSLRELGCAADCPDLFAALSRHFAHWLAIFARGAGFPAIREAWLERALPPGTPMSVKQPAKEITGSFVGIDRDGRLALDTRGGLVHVDAGDVFLA